MQYYEKNFKGLSVKECDKIALERAGAIYSTGYGYALPRGGEINEEYESKVIGTKGMGNYGTIILVGKTPRARRLLKEGKIRKLMSYGIRETVAKAAVSMPYGMEKDVVRLADDILELVRDVPYKGNSHDDFDRWCGFSASLSYPRKIAALAIAEAANNPQIRRRRCG